MKKIILARGLPPLSVMRKLGDDLIEAFRTGLEEDAKSFLQYGHFTGYAPLREYVAERFGVKAERVIIANGSMDALHHFLLFLRSTHDLKRYCCGKEVYDRPLVIARKIGLDLHGVDLTEEGLNVEQVRSWAEQNNDSGVIYTIPWFDNPSGIQHSDANRNALGEIAERNNLYLIRDGAYLDLDYFNDPIYPEVPEYVLQTFTWSKTISAGCHIGGVIIPENLAAAFQHFISSWRLSPVMPTQVAAHHLIQSGKWDAHMKENVLPDGRARVELFNKLMQEYLPESRRREILGGHFWGGKIEGITTRNWGEFTTVADEEYGLQVPHHGGFMPLSPEDESAGYIRIPLFLEDPEIPDMLERVVKGLAGARDTVA